MGSFSIWHWLVVIILMIPIWKIAKRAGFSGFYSLLMLIPLVNIAVLYLFAFVDWPLGRQAKLAVEKAPEEV